MTQNFLRFECFTKHLISVKKLTKNVFDYFRPCSVSEKLSPGGRTVGVSLIGKINALCTSQYKSPHPQTGTWLEIGFIGFANDLIHQ